MREPLLDAIAKVAAEAPTAEKWLVMRSLRHGHLITERLARVTGGWVNLRPITPWRLARQVLMATDPAALRPLLDDTQGPAVTLRLLQELPAAVPGYFRKLEPDPGLGRLLWGCLQEIRLAGLGPEDLLDAVGEVPEKIQELRVLLEAYERYLAEQPWMDHPGLLAAAHKRLPDFRVSPGTRWLLPSDAIWAPLERALIEALPGERVWLPYPAVRGLQPPRRLTLSGPLPVPPTPPAPLPSIDSARLAWLFAPEQAPPPLHDGSVQLFRAAGHDAEIHEVLRRVLAAGWPLDTVEVACATAEPYVGLLWELSQRLDLPITLRDGLPVSQTRPGRALARFCDWLEAECPAADLRRLLQSGALAMGEDAGLTPGQAARLLLDCIGVRGRDAYRPALTHLVAEYEVDAAHAEREGEPGRATWKREQIARLGALGRFIHALLACAPSSGPDGQVNGPALIEGCRTLLATYARISAPEDGEAREGALPRSLAALGRVIPARLPLHLALALVRETLARRIREEGPKPGALYVTRLDELGLSGRPHRFLVGLDQARVSGPRLEDAVLLDDERARHHRALATSTDHATERLHRIATRLATVNGTVTAGYTARDLREDREVHPDSLFLQFERLLEGRPGLGYEELDRALPSPVTRVPATPEQALDATGWWLRTLRGADPATRRAAVLRAFPWLAAGQVAEAGRTDRAFGPYDGLVPDASALLHPARSGQPLSATRLERLAACAFRYFLEHGLRVEPMPELPADLWLDALTRGHLLHELFAEALRLVRRGGPGADRARLEPWLRRLADEKLERLRVLLTPPNQWVFEHERDELYRDLALFLQLECDPGHPPVGVEVSFGLGQASPEEPLACPDPVPLHVDGEGVPFWGSIDRIDRVGERRYEVVDYKTGWRWGWQRQGAILRQGRHLQLPVYARVAELLLQRGEPGALVIKGSYRFPTTRGQGLPVTLGLPAPDVLERVLAALLAILRTGAFAQTPDRDECERCEFALACGRNPWERAGVKHTGGDVLLDPFRTLAQYE